MAWTLSTCISETVSSMFTSSSLGSCAMVAVVGWRAQSAELRRWWRRGRVRVKTAAVAEQTWAGANTLRERQPVRECLNSGDVPHGDSTQRRAHSTQASCEAPPLLPPKSMTKCGPCIDTSPTLTILGSVYSIMPHLRFSKVHVQMPEGLALES